MLLDRVLERSFNLALDAKQAMLDGGLLSPHGRCAAAWHWT